ncbi:IS630-like element ISRso5 family transposase [Ralstonia pseudosolanacearum]|uniref:Isrso5-transposase protein n=2 Tax=Ralstonia pseudosolanacearum TaxID=1310165 RepID=Q8XFA0_RALN1|nr:IS630-like element ISRso5 family transposase [Ralstonia pseudosolanacearum]AST25814.1 IS630 family transposase ISRso5 [Ralstonia pseudosolanacearum]AST26308.1 IS630 family transposase ISRso5 [Ralstonia pseudosolanacearum]AST27714.1 IS630 family transposase ISRso5 [Ralstonia pseudosolanacearum]AST28860.1 IS630 family transposase ISRso5 [Ralstonia pseudosolanacearum]AST29278.1 IS630 family transposase ISRso5 [Ralstonia pseudosolanacearum]
MPMGRPKAELVLSEDEQTQLAGMVRSRSIPAALVMRARLVLAAAAGEPNSEIAERLQLTRATVGKWRARFLERRINGLYDELRPGKPRTIDDERVAELIKTTLHTKPADGSTHWSVRAVAAETSISPTSVHRYFKLLGLQPHRSETFKLSTDAFFIEKLRDVVGLYLNPPENALVLCVDEKSQCQALERTQPMLPMGLGYVEGVTHDYVRHGTTTLFAALNVLNGAVLAECKPRHRHQEFLAFLRSIDKAVPADLDVHCIVDNYSSHKHPKVKAWLAARPRWHMHFIPTYSSWLNQVERFFAIITDKAIRRGSFTSVKELVQKIDHFVAHYNQNCKPFAWTATADSILSKLSRLCERISGTGH